MGNHTPFLDLGGPQGTSVYGHEEGYLVADYIQRTGSAVALGDVLQVDHTKTASETVSADNSSTSVQGTVVAPTAAFIIGNAAGLVAVVTDLYADDGADNSKVQCAVYGEVEAYQIAASGSVAIGDELTVTTAKNFDLIALTNERIFAQGRQALTTPTTRTLGTAFVDNWMTFTAGAYGTVV